MRRPTFGLLMILLTTLAVLWAAWYWAFVLLTSFEILSPASWTDADLIRSLWHFRLIRPEWVGSPPEYLRWAWTETLTRIVILFSAGWQCASGSTTDISKNIQWPVYASVVATTCEPRPIAARNAASCRRRFSKQANETSSFQCAGRRIAATVRVICAIWEAVEYCPISTSLSK